MKPLRAPHPFENAGSTLDRAAHSCPGCGTRYNPRSTAALCPACLLRAALLDHREETPPDPAPDAALAPRVFGDFEILSEAGRGGMGVVYRARQRQVGRIVALKLLQPGRLISPREVERFEREAETIARLEHPHILPLYSAGHCQGQPWFAVKWMDGGSLAQRLSEFRLPEAREPSSMRGAGMARLIRTIAQAVHHAHQRGVLHRDLKPGNILLDADGAPAVADFGLARALDSESALTRTGAFFGSPAYSAPEQAASDSREVTVAADIYGVGSIFYELLTGRPPFAGKDTLDTLRHVVETAPVPPRSLNPGIPLDLETICLKCLEKEPARRYATAQELAEDLERYLKDEPIVARPVSLSGRMMRWCRRRPAVAGLSAGLVLALAAGFAGTLWQLAQARRNAAENVRQLSRLHVLNGVNLMQDGDHFRSLLWFAEASAFSVDSPQQAAVARQSFASILAQGPRLAAVVTHDRQPVAGAAFHPREDRLATVGRDGRLRVWEMPGARQIFQTQPLVERPSHVLFAPGGGRILVTSFEFNQARLFSASDGSLLAGPVPHFAGGANNQPLSPRFDATGERLLAQSAPKSIRMWNVRDASPLGPAIALDAAIAQMDFGPDNDSIIALTQDGRKTVWNGSTGQRIETVLAGSQPKPSEPLTLGELGPRVSLIAANPAGPQTPNFSSDRTKIAIPTADRRVRVWNAATGAALTPPIDHDPANGPVEFSAGGRYFFTVHPAHVLLVWELVPVEPPVLLRPLESHRRTVAESGGEGAVLATRDPSHPIRVRALAGPPEVTLHPSSLKFAPVQAWFDATGQYLVLEYPNQRAQIWAAATGLPVGPIFQSREATNPDAYLTARLPTDSLALTETEDRSDGTSSKSQIANRKSKFLSELLSGSRLDGTGGWKPLDLGEIRARWEELKPLSIANERNK